MPKIIFSEKDAAKIKELQELLEANPHLQVLYFTRDGNYYVNSYMYKAEGTTEEKEYVRVGLLHTAANKVEAILDQYEVVAKFTREEILSAAPAEMEPVKEPVKEQVKKEETPPPPPPPPPPAPKLPVVTETQKPAGENKPASETPTTTEPKA